MAKSKKQNKNTFTVDTHLFRELGELLVGRDSTALIELVKNAYDADATSCTVTATRLDSDEHGSITVTDDGTGMTEAQFRAGFLRIATRSKTEQRVSARFGRRYTGSKGIGRLAAHKLARKIKIESTAADPKTLKLLEKIRATIDWDEIERCATLDELHQNPKAIKIEQLQFGPEDEHGTTLTLAPLRKFWTVKERQRFVDDATAAAAPPILTKRLTITEEKVLFATPRVASVASKTASAKKATRAKKWKLDLLGDLDIGDDIWSPIADATDWVLELRVRGGKVAYSVAPTKRFASTHQQARPFVFPSVKPDYVVPDFDCRVFIRTSNRWRSRKNTGVRIFQEGFRVPPYGEEGDDWLKLDEKYSMRSRKANEEIDPLMPAPSSKDDRLMSFTNRHCVGAVFLTREDAPQLKSLISREGFVPDRHFDGIQQTVINGLSIVSRAYAQASEEQREERRNKRSTDDPSGAIAGASPAPNLSESATVVSQRLQEITDSIGKVVATIEQHTPEDTSVTKPLFELQQETLAKKKLVDQSLRAARDEQAMMRVLASIGTQMAAFIHELNALLGSARRLQHSIAELSKGAQGECKKALRSIYEAADRLTRAIEQKGAYLSDVVTPNARRRRRRFKVADVFAAAWALVEAEATRSSVELKARIPADLKLPPMFRAEIVAIFSNLLTNAMKAAGPSGRILVVAKPLASGKVRITMSNTGEAVDLDTSEDLFRPFVSTTTTVDPVLGLGMGLGLPITRAMLREYGAEIEFVPPTGAYSSAVRISFPKS